MTAPARIADRYRVERRIGSGGMSTVFLAEDERLGRKVAVKRLHPGGDETTARRLQREARIGAGLRHPNLVGVFDVLTQDAELIVIMEYVEGEDLRQAMRRGRLSPARGLEVLRAVADALDHVHAQGVVHRDVKPANVLLGASGAVKLADLGIAVAGDSTRITQTGTALGSVAYMAPEQLEGGRASSVTDVWALATMAFEVLGGRKARLGATPMEIVGQVVDAPPPDLRDVWPDAPAGAAAALERAMARDPAVRTPSAGALMDELEAGLGEPEPEPGVAPEPESEDAPEPPTGALPAPAFPPPPPPRRQAFLVPPDARGRRAGPLVAAGLLIAVAIAVAVLVLGGGSGEQRAATPSATAEPTAAPTAAATASPTRTPSPTPADPAGAVRTFYARAVAQDPEGVCALRGPALRARFSCDGLTNQFATLRSVTFRRARLVSRSERAATVAIATTARHTDRTDRCEGTIGLVREASPDWLLDDLSVDCG